MSARLLPLPALSRLGGLALVLLMALALLMVPPPALRQAGSEQAAVLVAGAAMAAPARMAAVKAPKAEPADLPPLTLAEAAPRPRQPGSAGRLVAFPLPSGTAQRRAPGQGARAPPVFFLPSA